MKKFLKSIISLGLAIFVLFGLTACKTPISATTVSDEKSIVDGVSTNGGITAIHGEYLYFINGTKTNDGSSSRNNTQGSICRVKYDVESGKVQKDAQVEIVVSDLVGYEDGSINIFGDFLYYTTPCADVNYQGTALCYKTEFKRYDLVNGIAHHIYTTGKNDSNENVSYAYYVVEDSLYLLIYENVSKLLTSVKIDSNEIVYQISDVETCVFSDNNGKRFNEDMTDANNFVFYTKSPTIAEDGYDVGAKVYKTAPNRNNSVWMGNKSADEIIHKSVSILSIKNGKLIYSVENDFTTETYIYAQTIGESSKLEFNDNDIISYNPYDAEGDMILFDELSDGRISIIAYDASSYQIVYIEQESGENVPHTIINFGAKKEVDFVGKSIVEEVTKNEEGEIINTDEVEYLIYTVTESEKVSLYKIEVKRNGVVTTTPNLESIADSDSMEALNGYIMPESIGNNLFVIAKDEDKNLYMHFIDISVDVDEENKLTIIGKV